MSRTRTRLQSSEGFTMIEVIVTVMIVLAVVGALTTLFVNSNRSSYSSQREISQLSILQSQIERIRQTVKQYGFTAVALTSAPTPGTNSPLPTNPTNPNDFVSGSGCSETFTVQSNYSNSSESYPTGQTVGDNPEALLVNGCTVSSNSISGGQLAPLQYADLATGNTYASASSVPTSHAYATIYTFVTQTSSVGCNTSLGTCTGDARRVILASVLHQQAPDLGASYPIYSSTVFANPVASNAPTTASGLRILGLIP